MLASFFQVCHLFIQSYSLLAPFMETKTGNKIVYACKTKGKKLSLEMIE